MSSTAFTIDFDETAAKEPPKSAHERIPGAELEKENRSLHNDVLAWEVEFSSTGGGSQKAKKMPKFLRDRELARQARMEQLKKESESARPTPPQASSKKGTRQTSSPPQAMKSRIPSPRSSIENRPRTVVPPRPASVAAFSTQKIKRSPAIKQPLLLVQSSPRMGSPERRTHSASNSPLSSRSRLVKPSARPSSAKTSWEMGRPPKTYTTEFTSPLREDKEPRQPKAKKVQYMYMCM